MEANGKQVALLMAQDLSAANDTVRHHAAEVHVRHYRNTAGLA